MVNSNARRFASLMYLKKGLSVMSHQYLSRYAETNLLKTPLQLWWPRVKHQSQITTVARMFMLTDKQPGI